MEQLTLVCRLPETQTTGSGARARVASPGREPKPGRERRACRGAQMSVLAGDFL